jgi:transposase
MARSAIHYLRKRGLSQQGIAEHVGCERRTVARALTQPVEHRYRRARRPSPLEAWRETVERWLDEESPVRRMFELVRGDVERPFTGSAATWYRWVKSVGAARAATAAPVIRFEGLPGEFLQVDSGDVRLRIAGGLERRVFLAARLKYSRTVAVRWRCDMTLETLLRGLLEIATELGGVPWAWVFDNMKTVSLGRDAAGQPRWNPAFARLAAEVGFHAELCDPHAAQQKGSVENLVKFVKTNFVPGRSFVDDEDLSAQSAQWCAAKNAEPSQAHRRCPIELLTAEQAAFGELRTTAETYGLYRVATVNRESLVRADGNQYSVPTGHIGQAVDVRLLAHEVIISRDGVELARWVRATGRGERRRNPAHYAEALTYRPRARMVLERDALCALGPEVTAYITAVCRKRRDRMREEIDALVRLRTDRGEDAARVATARAMARAVLGAEYLECLAGGEPDLQVPTLPPQPIIDRDLASYEAFVQHPTEASCTRC